MDSRSPNGACRAQHARRWAAAALLVSLYAVFAAGCSAGEGYGALDQFTQEPLGTVRIYRPPQAVRHLVLLISGSGGWGSHTGAIAQSLAVDDALVAGIDGAQFLQGLAAGPDRCASPAEALAALVQRLEARYQLPQSIPVILAGQSAGASLAYVALTQAPAGTFTGALTLSFCTGLDLTRPLCPAPNLRGSVVRDGFELAPGGPLPAPWIALHGSEDRVCPASAAAAFVQAVPGARFTAIPGADHNLHDRDRWWPMFLAAYHLLAGTP